ncbi:MAG: hypothetical protein V7K47_03065 [Nostoc sp.]
MLKHTKCLFGATLFYFTTVTVVYGNTPRELCQNGTNVFSQLCKEVRVDENSEVLPPESQIRNFRINIVQNPIPSLIPKLRQLRKTLPRQVEGSLPIGSVFDSFRNLSTIMMIKKSSEQQPFQLASSKMRNTYIMTKWGEKIFGDIWKNLNPVASRATKVAMIPDGYGTIAQSEPTQQSINDAISRSLYMDIRTKLTYWKTFSDALEAMKKLGNYPGYSRIRNQVRSDLENNIKELSNTEALVQQFNASIPDLNNKNLITEHEKQFAEFAIQQIRQAKEIPRLKETVSYTMNQSLNDSVEVITSVVNQELKLTNCNNSGLRSSNQRQNRSITVGNNL